MVVVKDSPSKGEEERVEVSFFDEVEDAAGDSFMCFGFSFRAEWLLELG